MTKSPTFTDPQGRTARVRFPKGLGDADCRELLDLLSDPIDFMPAEVFEEADAESQLFDPRADIPRADTSWYGTLLSDLNHASPQQPSALKLLSAKQERVLFLRYNYARWRAEQARASIRPARVAKGKAEALLHWSRLATALREQLAEYNLGLVLAMARRLPTGQVDYGEMISEGNLALLRAIDKFDVLRGFKFSTYACRAILKAFSRHGIKTSKYRGLFPVGFDPEFERSNFAEEKAQDTERDCAEQVRHLFDTNAPELSELEQQVIIHRFQLDTDEPAGKGMTLEQVGKMIGLTKERVRQIQNKALAKMRESLEDTYLSGKSIDAELAEA